MPSYYATRGEFVVTTAPYKQGEGMWMTIEFHDFVPDPDAVVVLIQAIKCTKGPNLATLNENFPSGGSGVAVSAIWTPQHWAIDAPGESRVCPAFGMEFKPLGSRFARWRDPAPNATAGGTGRVGLVTGHVASTFRPAMLNDNPSRDIWASITPRFAFHHQFEVVALRIDPKLKASVRGVLTWGYTQSETGVHVDDRPVAGNRPSQRWIDAALSWNAVKTSFAQIPGQPRDWGA